MELYESMSEIDSFWDGLFGATDIIEDIGSLIADLVPAVDKTI